jgi:hypothetical protein
MGVRAIGLVLLVLATSCAASSHSILERKDIQFFKSLEEGAPQHPTLILSGLAFDSALVVQGCNHQEDGDTIVVLIDLELAHPGASGNFKCSIPISSQTNTIVLGNERAVVWKRGRGPSN